MIMIIWNYAQTNNINQKIERDRERERGEK